MWWWLHCFGAIFVCQKGMSGHHFMNYERRLNLLTLLNKLSPDYGSDTTTASTIGHTDHEGGNCDFTDIVDVDGQHYTTAGIRTNEDGILKFEFDKNVPLEVSLMEVPDITFNCINEICTSNDPVDAGTWTISVKNTFPEDDPWDVPPLIKTYFVDDKNYCGGCSHTMSAAGGHV